VPLSISPSDSFSLVIGRLHSKLYGKK
jgi:hypothetical protein